MPIKGIIQFVKHEAFAGILLMITAVIGIAVKNSPLVGTYDSFLTAYIGFGPLKKSALHWINDGLMALFFLIVALELKREFLYGYLSTWRQAVLPLVGAIGGIAAPALLYVALNLQSPESLGGWAIPAATDIAFALGILMLFGKRVPLSLKVFLTCLAVFDDVAAIVIIAVFYSSNLSYAYLTAAFGAVVVLFLLSRFAKHKLWPFLLVGLVLWFLVLKSGIHATLAGVIVGLFIHHDSHGHSPLEHLEHTLHPWVAYFILPLFAFANAGVALGDITTEVLFSSVALGITAGLFIGKQLGIFLLVMACAKRRWLTLPHDMSTAQLYALSCLAGIGFTMSLFIGGLAFTDKEMLVQVKVGVLSGSLLSALLGSALLAWSLKSSSTPVQEMNSERSA